jgi:hypothetical protein
MSAQARAVSLVPGFSQEANLPTSWVARWSPATVQFSLVLRTRPSRGNQVFEMTGLTNAGASGRTPPPGTAAGKSGSGGAETRVADEGVALRQARWVCGRDQGPPVAWVLSVAASVGPELLVVLSVGLGMRALISRVMMTAAAAAAFCCSPAHAATVSVIGQLTPSDASLDALTVASVDPDHVLALTSAGALMFTEPSAGWGSETEAAQLSAPIDGTDPPFGGVMSTGLVALSYLQTSPGNSDGQVFVEPETGWQGMIKPSAQLRDSNGDEASPAAISNGVIFANAESSTKPAGHVDVFSQPPGGWSGTVTQSAQLADSRGWRTEVDTASGLGVIAFVSDDHGHSGFDLFTEPRGGWTGTVHEAARLDVEAGPTGRAALGTPVVTVDDRVYVRPARGWHGTIKPVAALYPQHSVFPGEPQAGAQLSGTRAIEQAVPIGVPTNPEPIAMDYWFFDEPNDGWSGELESQPVVQYDGTLDGDTGFIGGSGAINIVHLSGLRQRYGHRPVRPVAHAQPLRGLATGSPSLRIISRVFKDQPPVSRVQVTLPSGLAFTSNAPSVVQVNGLTTQASLSGPHSRTLSAYSTLSSAIDVSLPTGALRESPAVRKRARNQHGPIQLGRGTIRLIDLNGLTTTRPLVLTDRR